MARIYLTEKASSFPTRGVDISGRLSRCARYEGGIVKNSCGPALADGQKELFLSGQYSSLV